MKIPFHDEEKYLIKTSKFLLLPSFYAFYNNIPYIAFIGGLGSLISLQFWSKPYTGFRRNLDLIYQPFISSYFFILGNFYSNNYMATFLGNTTFLYGLYYYNQSHSHYKQKKRTWVINHIFFHSMMFFTLFFTYKTQIKN